MRQRYARQTSFRQGDRPSLTVIGVGGIQCAQDVQAFLIAGVDLVQIYTAFVYQGPGLVRQLLQGR